MHHAYGLARQLDSTGLNASVGDDLENIMHQQNHLHLDLILGLPHEDLPSYNRSFNQVFSLLPHYIQMGLLKVLPEKRRYTKGDFEPLSRHYSERIFQVHVMHEYARQGTEKIAQALKLVLGYFTMERSEFVRRFFSDRSDILERATGHESFIRIVEALRNPEQQSLVSAPEQGNLLVLAGPGAGKTRVVVHRCAYLLRVERVAASRILVLCFNRSSVSAVRRRLRELVGRDGAAVAVYTYHGLALRLVGQSPLALAEKEGELDFSGVLRRATELLRGECEIPGLAEDEYRDRLLSGWRYILVDEYQDIDGDQYRLISALSGRTLEADANRLTIMAVGDDDQNIYSFRGSGTEFIRRFRDDYQAEVRYLVENYRSTAFILAAADQVISRAGERMKKGHPVQVDRARIRDDPGGRFHRLDSFGRGRVHCIEVDAAAQAGAVSAALQRLREVDRDAGWQNSAVLARNWSVLSLVRGLCEEQNIPVDMVMDSRKLPPLHRVREFALFIDQVHAMQEPLVAATSLIDCVQELQAGQDNRWWRQLSGILDDWLEEAGDGRLPLSMFLEYLFETLGEQRRERRADDAVFLGTVHAAKGLEFSHVLLLDGGWSEAVQRGTLEEERRLYYVAMTRARETLTLFQDTMAPNPFSQSLSGDFLLRSRIEESGVSTPTPCRYTLLGLKDIDLGYAGRRSPDHSIHVELAALTAGSPLTARQQGDRVLLLSGQRPVAALSRAASAQWKEKIAAILSIQVIAMVRRMAEDGDPSFRSRYHTRQWEVPLVEITWR